MRCDMYIIVPLKVDAQIFTFTETYFKTNYIISVKVI